jgi:hypothetical protein
MITFARRLFILIPFLLTIGLSGATAQNPRLTVVISDTHFGVGKTPGGMWHPYEDARWATEFGLFLKELNRLGKGKTDLIFNGDTFELWQSLENDCTHQDENLGCTEKEALKRLKTVIAAHQVELAAIKSFAEFGDNKVFIVPGNHDAALLFPEIAAAVSDAIGAERVNISPEGYWLSADGLIYAEHGHQIENDLNLFASWPNPLVGKNGVIYVQRPWGENFVQRFYNQYEMKYPIIDNMMSESMGVTYGIKAEGYRGVVKAFGKFARFYLFQSSWAQIGRSLGKQKGGQWDIAAIRERGDRFLFESIPNDDPLRALVEKELSDRTLGLELNDLTNEEIQGICDGRAAMVTEDKDNQKPLRVELCPKADLGAGITTLTKSHDAIFQKHLDETQSRLSKAGSDKLFSLFIFAHTHVPVSSYSPFARSTSNWKPIVVNSGAWQRTISEEQLKQYMKDKNWRAEDVLKLQPEDLPPCYPVVMVSPYSSTPRSVLRYWRQAGGTWSLENNCK